MEQTLTVKMTPVPKARARVLRTGRSYTPKKTACAEALIRGTAQSEGLVPYAPGVPLAAGFFFAMPMPASWSRKKRSAMNGKPHAQKPDLDNLIKLVKDALNGVVWPDDAQIASDIGSEKWWTLDPVGHIGMSVRPL